MNKVLLIANFHESSGWGECVRNFALAMDSVGIEVVCRSIKLDKANYPITGRLEELLNKSSKNCNICLQYLLPMFMQYDGNFDKCIGIYLAETDKYQYSDYVTHLNCMDEVWVPNNDMVDYALNSGVKVPIKIVPLAFNPEKYTKEYPPFEIPEAKGDFIFYFIGEAIRRKNLIAAIKAFHMEFSPNEPVQFVIKANKTGLSSEDCTKFLQELCFTAKSNLRLYRDISTYKSEIIITSSLSDDDIARLHHLCDCHIMPGYGESWNIPCFEAICYGNRAIASNEGGPKDYINHLDNGYLVQGQLQPCFGMEGLPNLYTAREQCFEVDMNDLCRAMRWAYDNRNKPLKANVLKNYSYEVVGDRVKGLLN